MVERGETPLQCAVRETAEEVGVHVRDATPLAELRFEDADGSRMLGVAFKARLWRGDLVETAEAAPFWCSVESLPYGAMWEDDVLWLPWVLEERPVIGSFLMHDERLVSHRLAPTSCARLLSLAAQPIT
jgi:8-oxo-dGTP pyrophosphatase MutT (NUDIX family)